MGNWPMTICKSDFYENAILDFLLFYFFKKKWEIGQ